MLKLMYFAIFISLTALLACSDPEKSPPPTAVAQAPAAESIMDPTTNPVETLAEDPVPAEDPIPAEDPAQAESPIPAGDPSTAPAEGPEPTDAPSEITPGPRTPDPSGMNSTEILVSDLSDSELSCISEIGDPQQLMKLMNNPEFESPEERNALALCLENETLLKIFLKGFTDQTGPLSSDTSACISAGLQNFDLHAMMLTNPEGLDTQATMVTLSCLNEDEWKAASPALDLQPEGREALQCVMNKMGGPEGIVASLEFKEGEPPLALSNAVAECGLTIMMEGPPG